MNGTRSEDVPVDLVIPYYGSPTLLSKTVRSVLRQNGCGRWASITVVDDGCPRPASGVQGRASDPQVVVVRNPRNLGLVGNWNRCLTVGSAGFICLVHCDDLLHPDFLDNVREAVRAHPNAGLIHSFGLGIIGNLWTPRGARSRFRWAKNINVRMHPKIELFPAGDEAVRNVMRGVLCSSVVINRQVISALGGFREDLPFSADEEYWARIGSRFDVIEIPAKLIAYRTHVGSHRIKTWLEPDFWDSFVMTRRARFGYLRSPLDADRANFGKGLAQVAVNISLRLFAAGEFAQAKAYLSRAQEEDHSVVGTRAFQRLSRLLKRRIMGRPFAWFLTN